MRTKYKYSTTEWEEVELGIIYNICCCDCNLVHNYEYKKEKGKIFVRTSRNERATGQLRRHNKYGA